MTTTTTSPGPPPDVVVLVPLLFFINGVTYYLTYSHLTWDGRMLLTFGTDLAQGYVAWGVMRAIICYLDRRLPYEQGQWQRLAWQLPLTCAGCLVTLIGLTELLNALVAAGPVPAVFYQHHVVIFFIWALFINVLYVGLHYQQQFRQAAALVATQHAALAKLDPALTDSPVVRPTALPVLLGSRVVQVPFEAIAGCYVESEATMLHTTTGSRYVLSQSLDKLAQELPAEWFYRLNRQYLLHRHSLAGYERQANGKLLVRLLPLAPLPADVSVSRLRAPAFKKWFRK